MGLLDLLLPPACAACGAVSSILCRRCIARLDPPGRASDRFVVADPGVVLGDALVIGVAAFAHRGPARRGLASLKYAGASRIAALLAAEALPALARLEAVAGDPVLVPVPVHAERRRIRGYNQAELLAHELARGARLPVADLLVRRLPTTKQHGLNRADRMRNLRGAFGLRDGADVPATVVLIDDIVTTTATLEACARVLRDAGSRMVYGFAIAREV